MQDDNPQTQPPATERSFPFWMVVLAPFFVLFLYFAATILGGAIAYIYPLLNGWSQQQSLQWLQTSIVAQFVYILAVEVVTVSALYALVRGAGLSGRLLGLVRPKLRDVGAVLLAIPPYVIGYVVLLSLATMLFPSIDVNQEQQIGFKNATAPLELILIFISLAILPPLVEELVMRGFLFGSLVSRMNFVVAASITSIIFAVLHLQLGSGAPPLWIAAIDTFILSMVLCYLRYKTGSLWPPILLHGLKNSLAFVVLFLFPIWGVEIPGV